MSREHDQNMASPPQQPIIYSGCLRQRDPSTFSGTDDQDVEDWLSSYERVSSFNKWDDVLKLNNIIFYLTNVAKLWFKNHEAEFQTWPRFKARFVEVFGRPAVRLLCAEQRLRERAQQAGENFTSYIEDILDLCKRVNPLMPEKEKIKHILKGIEDGAFHMLLGKNAETVTEVVICARVTKSCEGNVYKRGRSNHATPAQLLALPSLLTSLHSYRAFKISSAKRSLCKSPSCRVLPNRRLPLPYRLHCDK